VSPAREAPVVAPEDASRWPEQPLAALLEEAASDKPAPGGGSIAAIVAAMAAALVEKSARLSPDWRDARGAGAQAKTLRGRALPLAEEDAEAYGAVLEALRSKAGDDELRKAYSRAADVPLTIARTALDVAELAREAVDRGNPNLRGDVVAASVLAAGAAASAGHLVGINLGARPDDPRVQEAEELIEDARRVTTSALQPPAG
jgi:formiminotetrahydrofolate cyclodeaminase